MGRFVPFLAVATANCINIPMMRQGEISNGVIVVDKDGRQLGESKVRDTLCLLSSPLSSVLSSVLSSSLLSVIRRG